MRNNAAAFGTASLLGPLLLAGGCAAGGSGYGAPWSILCLEAPTPLQAEYVEQIADTLRRTRGIRAKEVVIMQRSDGGARLYYGTYFRPVDRSTGKRKIPARMRKDLTLIRQLGDASGRRYFAQAMPAPAPIPDVGNPEWVLAHVEAEYSLQVAVFEPTEELRNYKEAAAQFCAMLRREGYEAYYHHASSSSMVTVGAFGSRAVIRHASGRVDYSSEVEALRRVELLKHNLLNGRIMRVRNDDGVMVPILSLLVETPRRPGADRP